MSIQAGLVCLFVETRLGHVDKLASNSQSCWHCLPNARIIGMRNLTGLHMSWLKSEDGKVTLDVKM